MAKAYIAPAGPCSLVAGHTHYTLSEHLCNGNEGIICKYKELDKKLPENTQNEEEPKKCRRYKNMNKKAK